MNRLLGVGMAALCSMAYAEATVTFAAPENLKGVRFCIASYQIRSGDSIKDNASRDFSEAQFQVLKDKFGAYRVPTSQCTHNLWVNFSYANLDTAPTMPKAYLIEMYVSYPNSDTLIYASNQSGVTNNYSDSEMRTYLATVFTKLIDRLAADYAKANP